VRKKQGYSFENLTMGTCYYPEHWDESLWENDLDRMLDAGISLIRVGEFAWSFTEPEEGEFTFDFWDKFLLLCENKGMNVVMGTPTATPPAWLTEKYPEVLNADINGVLYRHGGRKHHNYNSPKYRELTSRIVSKLGERYGKHPSIIGWQIDNELNCEVNEFYSDADDLAFREFLKEKYTSIDALNKAWGTAFWNQQYTDFEEVHIPQPVLSEGKNPHRYLDYYRFISASAMEYCEMQAKILREYIPEGVFITTNGLFWNLDNHKMMDDSLDIYMYDSYPSFAFGLDRGPEDNGDLRDRHWSKNLTETRSICPNFAIMEQQSGANGWVDRLEGPAPRPGKLKLWALQSVAHGADMVSFFRWRTATMGTEMYWHGILDYDNRDNRKLAEVKDFYQTLKKINEVCGSSVVAQVGIVKDYDNLMDTNTDLWHKRISEYSDEAIFEAAQLSHTTYDYVYINDDTDVVDLSVYKVLLYAHPVIMTEKRAEVLKKYVEQGGTLILGCRSGYKNVDGQCVMMPQPGLLAKLTGSDVYDFTFTNPVEEPVMIQFNGEILQMPVFNDICRIREGEDINNVTVLARYENNYYAGAAAIIEKRIGEGKTIHFGAAFSKEIVKALFEYTEVAEPLADYIELPEQIEVVPRQKGDEKYYFLLNYTESRQLAIVKTPMIDLVTSEIVAGAYILEANSVVVFKQE